MFCCHIVVTGSSQSVAHIWNEMQLAAIRIDAARPPVQARNLFHVSMAMYDAWAAYDSVATTYLLGKTLNNTYYSFTGVPVPSNIDSARDKAISYAAYRVLRNRYSISPNWNTTKVLLDSTFMSLGYDSTIVSTIYASGDPAELGNYIAAQVISMGFADGANQVNNYAGTGYSSVNPPLFLFNAGNPTMTNVNRWQPLTYITCIDQNGIPCGSNTPAFVCPRWGKVLPFSMPVTDAKLFLRSGADYPVYYDPGTPPFLSTTNAADTMSQYLKWGHSLVSAWSSHLDENDTTMWDISPNGKGNIQSYPTTLAEQQTFYNIENGGEIGDGYPVNPITGASYSPQVVKRGDYTRIVTQYWADGPTSETPPGHWFTFLNAVTNSPGFQKRMGGTGPICGDLEWDVKTYFTLGAAMHDAAVACWGIKGWYDTPRPISMIRKIASYGQSSNPALPNYHPGGLALIPGYIEQVTLSDPASLRGQGNVNVNKIKLKAWRGFSNIFYSGTTPLNASGSGWILAENWMPYQRETFVSPPFAGYTSGHSTFSRSGAVCLTNLTGSPYFPGGMMEYVVPANSDFIGFEISPTTEIRLQWASYKDASDEASMSRIWGGIHPPFDDIPGRHMGEQIGNQVYSKAKAYFDNDVMSVSISSNLNNPVCEGSYITFTAISVNTPMNAIYQWKRNGIVVSSGASDSYTTSSFSDNDIFLCDLIGNGYKVASNTLAIDVQTCPTSVLSIKLFIEGYYNGSGTMKPVLTNQGIGSNLALTDSVDVELHSSESPYPLIASQRIILQVNGNLNCFFTCEPSSYYIVIKHRNALETWSSEPVLIGTATPYDFSASQGFAFGNNMKEIENGIWALYSGDINRDENIDILDYSLLEDDIGQFAYGYKASDINGDGNVDLLDIPVTETNLSNFVFSSHP